MLSYTAELGFVSFLSTFFAVYACRNEALLMMAWSIVMLWPREEELAQSIMASKEVRHFSVRKRYRANDIGHRIVVECQCPIPLGCQCLIPLGCRQYVVLVHHSLHITSKS
ncbi:hypothetical protein AMTR_s00041p00233240 [Amborella trichopoda]|uniref:Uncharacterized protein n=1 Tax=Amborella trichopoda TaxID=13333 RepID=W1PYV5_AMBTC|nr:hypothetical protein AMTR_s00041p00233240 [Amborella trichopoda]